MDCCYSFVAKVNSGFEDVSAQEIETLIGRKVEQGREKIFFDGNSSDVYKINLLSRSILKLLILCVRGRIHNFDDIYNISREIDYSQYIPAGKTFGVTGARHGDHEFTSMDVAGEVGQAVIDSVKKTRGNRLEVNLDSPDVEIYALLRHNELIVGINTTGESLHRRFYRSNTKHSAPLNPTVAYSLIHLSGWCGGPLLDPMCGTGTILIEAALLHNNISPAKHRDDFAFKNLSFFNRHEYLSVKNECLEKEQNKSLTLMGFDNSPNSIAEAKQNSRKAGISHLTTFGLSDVGDIEPEEKPEFIISNPPFGLRLKDPDSVSNIAVKFWNRISELGNVSVMIISGNKEFENKAPNSPLWYREVYLGGMVCRVLKYRL